MLNEHRDPDAAPPHLPRSVAAVLLGWAATVALSLTVDHVLQRTKILPGWGQPVWDPWLNLLALGYRCGFSVFGSYLAAKVAPCHPMLHAMMLGIIGFLLSLLGAVTAIQNNFGPAWYPLALAAATLPCAWLGGFLGRSRRI
jgi:hypothetical protein